MLTAIIFIVLIGILFAISFSLYSMSVQRTTDHYLYNQAQLLARSGVEYAILAVGGHDIAASGNCINNIDLNYNNTYDINITIYYIGKGLPAGCNILDNTLKDSEDNGTAIIDVRVSLNPSLLEHNPPITYVRRTIQKL